MAQINGIEVTAAPSGTYGFYVPANKQKYEDEPVVQVAQFIDGFGWSPTPARHYASTVAASENTRWPIDYGQGWYVEAGDTEAFKDYARQILVQYASA